MGAATDHLCRRCGLRATGRPILIDALHRMHEQFAWPGASASCLLHTPSVCLSVVRRTGRPTNSSTGYHTSSTTRRPPGHHGRGLDVHTVVAALGRGSSTFLVRGSGRKRDANRDLTYRHRLLRLYASQRRARELSSDQASEESAAEAGQALDQPRGVDIVVDKVEKVSRSAGQLEAS